MDFKFASEFSLQQALDIIYSSDEDKFAQEIYIAPPEPNENTDEDSAEEDEGGLVDNLPARQLSAPAEIRYAGNERCVEDIQNIEEENKTEKIWIMGDIEKSTIFPKSDFSEFWNKSPVELFEMFMDDSVFKLIVTESQKYALFLNCSDPQITVEEIKCFMGILILSGYNELPGKRRYWDSCRDMRNEMVYEAMRRDRFIQIMRFIHCASNTEINREDKIWKIRPLAEKLKQNFLKYFIPVENINFDESMVRYYGRHGCKQCIRGKPIRFGYKVWCLNAENGYLINFEIYQGKNPNSNTDYELKFGKSSAPLVVMLDEMPHKQLRYQIYTDNLFSSFKLFAHLRERGYGATGTIRQNRIPKSCPLPDKKIFKKQSRGSFDSSISKTDGIMLTRWMDNAMVTMISSTFGISPIACVKRYSQAQKKIIQVQRPNVVAQYNKFMGGTDRMDEDLNRYRIGIRGKKWYWPLFTWLIDSAIQNAWILYKCSGRAMTNLEFRREIVTTYLTKYKNIPKGPGRSSVSKNSVSLNRISDDIRYDNINHLVEPVPNSKRRRCAGEGCSSVGRTQCCKCNVGLCIECFKIFHTA